MLREKFLEDAAAKSEYTVSQLADTEERLEEALQSRLLEHFKRSRLHAGDDYWLFEQANGVWLGLNEIELQQEMESADMEYDYDKLMTVAEASLEWFQDIGYTVAVPGTVARKHEKPVFYPIHVEFPEDWDNGEWHTVQRFEELVSRYNMSPAEALDYWVVERMGKEALDWGGSRDVEPEAIRKNVRQAKDKLSNDSLGATPENAEIRAVSTDEIPEDEPHDPDEDVFYITEADSSDIDE